MITLKIKLNQFLIIDDFDVDDETVLDDLSDFEPEVVTSDIGEADITGSCEISLQENPKTAVRSLDITVRLHDDEQAKSFISEDMSVEKDLSDIDYLAFLRYYCGDWEYCYLNDERYDFENDLVSGELSE
jgi:hypothetical protein